MPRASIHRLVGGGCEEVGGEEEEDGGGPGVGAVALAGAGEGVEAFGEAALVAEAAEAQGDVAREVLAAEPRRPSQSSIVVGAQIEPSQ